MHLEEELSSCSTIAYYRQNLCQTISGNACPLITITSKLTGVRGGEQDEKEIVEGKTDVGGDPSIDCFRGGYDLSSLTVIHTADPGDKQYVVLTARIHPGETNSSWVMKGEVG